MVDNYDSFSYNLVHLVEKITHSKVTVFCNDKIDLDQVSVYDKIILSPGPGIPSEAGQLIPLIKTYASSKSILGVCLGHQAIAEAFGGTLENLSTVFHGVDSNCTIVNGSNPLFKFLPETFKIGHYHSWVVSDKGFPDVLEITARNEQGYIMALQHKEYDLKGVQFHPESVLTPQGEIIIRNWLNL